MTDQTRNGIAFLKALHLHLDRIEPILDEFLLKIEALANDGIERSKSELTDMESLANVCASIYCSQLVEAMKQADCAAGMSAVDYAKKCGFALPEELDNGERH